MKYLRLIILGLFFSHVSFAQQESSFSYYMFNHQAINPGYVGSRDVGYFTSVLRSQWAGVEGAPLTQTLSYSSPLNRKQLGFGFSVLNDKIGPIGTTTFAADIAYHLKLNRKGDRLALGLKAGIFNFSLNPDLITTITPNDSAFQVDQEQALLPNIGFGFYYYTKKYYAGIAVPQMLSNDKYAIEKHFYFIGGGLLDVSNQFTLKPSLLLRQTKSLAGYDLSLLVIYDDMIWLGGQIRNNFNADTFRSINGTGASVLMGLSLGGFTLGYSYGIPSSFVNSGVNASTHELMFRLDLSPKKVQGTLKSPRFF